MKILKEKLTKTKLKKIINEIIYPWVNGDYVYDGDSVRYRYGTNPPVYIVEACIQNMFRDSLKESKKDIENELNIKLYDLHTQIRRNSRNKDIMFNINVFPTKPLRDYEIEYIVHELGDTVGLTTFNYTYNPNLNVLTIIFDNTIIIKLYNKIENKLVNELNNMSPTTEDPTDWEIVKNTIIELM